MSTAQCLHCVYGQIKNKYKCLICRVKDQFVPIPQIDSKKYKPIDTVEITNWLFGIAKPKRHMKIARRRPRRGRRSVA